MFMITSILFSKWKQASNARSSLRRLLGILLFAFVAIYLVISYREMVFGDIMAAATSPESILIEETNSDSNEESFSIRNVFVEDHKVLSFNNLQVAKRFQSLGTSIDRISDIFEKSTDNYVTTFLKPLVGLQSSPIWLQSNKEAVWLPEYGVTLVVTRFSTSPSWETTLDDVMDRTKPFVLFFYAEALSEDGKPLKKSTIGGITYPLFLPINFYGDDKDDTHYGPTSHKLMVIKGENQKSEPLLIYTALLNTKTPRTYMTMLVSSKVTQEEKLKEYLDSVMAIVDGKDDTVDENWIPFVDEQERLGDPSILFIASVTDLRVIRCNTKSGVCKSVSEAKSFAKLGKHKILQGTSLISMRDLVPEVKFSDFVKNNAIENAWIGFVNYHLEKCGCGDIMTRPGYIVVAQTSDKKFKIVQLSSALDFDLDIRGWNSLTSSEPPARCSFRNVLEANSIINWKVSTGADGTIDKDIITIGLTFNSLKSFSIEIHDIIKNSIAALSEVKMSNSKGSDLTTAVRSSAAYCKQYGKKYGDSSKPQKEGNTEESLEGEKVILTLYPSYIEDPAQHFFEEFPDDNKKRKFVQLALSEDINKVFTKHTYNDYLGIMYDAFSPMSEEATLEQCEAIRTDFKFQVSETINKDIPLHNIIRPYLRKDKSLDPSQILYFEEFVPLLGDKVPKLLEDDEFLRTRWFRFAGSAVYLKEYGVNIMLSRISFAHLGIRNRLAFSMTYVQLYNSDWEEITDAELIVPSTDDLSQKFKKIRYPDFLRVPSYTPHNGQFYGPEDPRLILRVNALGHEEPIVIFNQFQRTTKGTENTNGEHIEFNNRRRLFLCFPWEYQAGKSIVDPVSFTKSYVYYNRISELAIYDENNKPLGKKEKEKNWTPFIMPNERHNSGGFDKYLYFVYQWDYMTVLKCTIPTTIEQEVRCKFIYQNLPARGIGELRGGTQLLSVNEVLKDLKIGGPTLDQDYWFGIGRSRVKKCGCGGTIYRPQFLLITKDDEMKFQVTHLTSFMTFDLEVLPYDEMQPNVYCGGVGPSIILPNGIGQWVAQEKNGEIDDAITFFFSNGDRTIDLLHIRGVLKELFRINAFRRYLYEEEMKELLPSDRKEGETYELDFFKNHAHITCSNKQSREYCRIFGEAHPDKGSDRQ